MADTRPEYSDSYLEQIVEQIRQEKEQVRQEKEQVRQEKEQLQQQNKRYEATKFEEYLQHCHQLLSRSLSVKAVGKCTAGQIPLPIGKKCHTRRGSGSRLHSESRNFTSIYFHPTFTP